MWSLLGITWIEAATVVVSTVSIYLVFIVFVRVVGQRSGSAQAGVRSLTLPRPATSPLRVTAGER